MLSYQGKLTDTGGNPVRDSTYNVAFRLYTVASGGTAFWSETQSVQTKSGLFTVLLGVVTPIGYVPDAGEAYLGMAVGGGAELTPRLRLVSSAYAYKADTANYALAAPGGGDNAWVRGTPDSVLFTIRQLGIARGGAGNALWGNQASTHVNFGLSCTTGTSGENQQFSTVGGGFCNTASKGEATVGGGHGNIASSIDATVGGGFGNAASGYTATVAGGLQNSATGLYATVAGGFLNAASGQCAMTGGGQYDTTQAIYGGILSGYSNTAGDMEADTAATVTGGYDNAATGKFAAVGGGRGNGATGDYATVAGGMGNAAGNILATVAGGSHNSATGSDAAVGGGLDNCASGSHSSVPGGYADTAAGIYSFATNDNSVVPSSYSHSAAFNGQTATAASQLRCGTLSKAGGSFTIDHPLDPDGRILNHYFVESPQMPNLYYGSVVVGADGRAEVKLPDYFSALNRNPMVQLTGVGASDVYLAEDVSGNRFVIGGKPGTKVYWTALGERRDVSAEIIRRMMPVEQPKTGELAGRMLDDEFLSGCMDQLVRVGKAEGIDFRTAAGRARYEQMRSVAGEK